MQQSGKRPESINPRVKAYPETLGDFRRWINLKERSVIPAKSLPE
jgi:hypothetical protein